MHDADWLKVFQATKKSGIKLKINSINCFVLLGRLKKMAQCFFKGSD